MDKQLFEITSGLLLPSAVIASKYFYDLKGSLLFESITQLDAYYLTRTEREILDHVSSQLIDYVGPNATIVDLGAGNCAKAASLFKYLNPSRYIAVDIASDFLSGVLKELGESYPDIQIHQMDHDFSEGVKPLDPDFSGPKMFFYPGSSIGNFPPEQASTFLESIGDIASSGDSVLIGIDLVKDKEVLEAAYNDPEGVTDLFNINILDHINRLASANFDTGNWQHLAFYNDQARRIEMHLISKVDQSVKWIGGERFFGKGSTILTEYSHKYVLPEFEETLLRSGFDPIQHWTDEKGWFALILARVS